MVEQRLYGLEVIINDTLTQVPLIQLGAACPCSSEVRVSFNKYLENMFGYRHEVFRIGNKLIMSNHTYQRVKGVFHE